MSLSALATRLAETAPIPDPIARLAIGAFVDRARRDLAARTEPAEPAFVAEMDDRPIAENTADANVQHYEVPAAFFARVLGPRLKYSSAYYETPDATLAQAEAAALALTCDHADLRDGQSILELGCGWGSLSLWMARAYPHAAITSVSNSRSQRAEIEARAHAAGLANLTVITADMNDFRPEGSFDRVVSVEMFEHMANWRGLLARIATWLVPGGRLFLHVFSHADRPYRFDQADPDDWIARNFFTGGLMPSHGLIRRFDDLFAVEEDWRWSGEHYRRTADDWLANFDRHADAIAPILRETYGPAARVWARRWRLFFLATSGLFGAAGGAVWGVSHYRLAPAVRGSARTTG